MLTKRMFWTTVATATAAASVFAWLMIKASDEYSSIIEPPVPPTPAAPLTPSQPALLNNTVSKTIGWYLTTALQAIRDKDFETAKSLLAQAEAVTSKTPFEVYKISEVWTYFYGKQRNYQSLLKAYEQMLANSSNRKFLSPEQAATITKTIAQLAFSTGEHSKSIELSRSWLADKPNDTEMRTMLASAYYATHNFQHCAVTARSTVEMIEQANASPNENLLSTLRFCANELGDRINVEWTTERLCRYYPKPEYWKYYIKLLSRNERSDFAIFYWYLLELDAAGKLERDDYTQVAQMGLTDYQLPATAQRAMEFAIAQRVFDTDIRLQRAQRIVMLATEAAAAARARIPVLVSETSTDLTGEKSFELGLIYFDNEQYSQAIAALLQALEKGRFDNLAHARMTLAIAYLKNGNRESARAHFSSVGADPTYVKLARAWTTRTYN